MHRIFRIALTALLVAAAMPAQAPSRNTYRANGGAAAAPRLISPEVHPDRTITFRLRAPDAVNVSLSFPGSGSKPMAKDASGLWTVTIGPVEPEIYEYTFTIDGARVIDTANTFLKIGRTVSASLVDVPGVPSRFDQVQNVPHGTIQIRTYTSTPLKRPRQAYIYVPPQYDTEPGRRFPVLYLRHGSGDDESTWTSDGRAGVILENLLAQRKAVPMLIVMTNGDTDGTWGGGSSPAAMEALGQELLGDVIPLVERHYRVLSNRENRAVTGLSMGGGQAFTIGLKHPETFAWVGQFSSGLVSDADFDLSKHLPGFLQDPVSVNRRLKLLFLSCGVEDPRMAGQTHLVATLKQHGHPSCLVQHAGRPRVEGLAPFACRVPAEGVPTEIVTVSMLLVGPAGLEPATTCLEGRCSIQLSYGPARP
jgi:enterochelin esterase-like enzyme